MFVCESKRSSHLFVLGYPPSDLKVREWFAVEVKSRNVLQDRCNSFLHALLTVTRKELTDISKELSDTLKALQGNDEAKAWGRVNLLSSRFRDKMAKGGRLKAMALTD